MPESAPRIRIATRSSQLALWQSNHVAELIRRTAPDCRVELVEVSTQGDQDRTSTLASMGGQGVFTKEVQAAVLDGRADVAVHSLKDLPTLPVDGLVLAAVPQRASALDALILPVSREPTQQSEAGGGSADVSLLDELPDGAKIGTGSPRRQAQLRHFRNDLDVLQIRGNVETRLARLDAGEYDAIVLAEAGLGRLNFGHRISMPLVPPVMLGAVGQGAIGVECRADDAAVCGTISRMSDPGTFLAVRAERSLMRELEAGCHAPVGVRSEINGTELRLDSVVLSLDGEIRIVASDAGVTASPEELGKRVAGLLCAEGAEALLRPHT